MRNTWTLILALLEGLLIGFVFFGGLWWTVRKGVLSAHPAALFLTSLLVRTAVAVVGFYFVSMGGWQTLTACLAGFVIGRSVVSRFTLHSVTASTQVAERGAL